MRISEPGHCSEENNRFLHRIGLLLLLANLLILSMLAGSISVVSVHIVSIISRRHFIGSLV
jgi:hypothetical protein